MPARTIYAELKDEHKELKGMFAELESATGAKRKKLFDRIDIEMTSHERAEEAVFYSKITKPKQTHELALEGYQEHHVADLVVAELRTEDHKTDEWKAKASVLQEIVEHHIKEEEGPIFTNARKVLDDTLAKDMVQQFESEKQKVSATLH